VLPSVSQSLNLEYDPAGVRENLLRISAVLQRFPDMILAPAHDARLRRTASPWENCMKRPTVLVVGGVGPG
jgi:hypothetical protein